MNSGSGRGKSKAGRGSGRTKATQFTGRGQTTRVKTAKGRKISSKLWLERQLNDPYVAEARARGYRSRAAFKLIELNDMFGLLDRGSRVVDLGAAPGGWTQVAVEIVKPPIDDRGAEVDIVTADTSFNSGKKNRIAPGKVVSLDIQEMDPITGATVIIQDFMADTAPDAIRKALNGPADLVLSDMASPATGHRQTDHLRIMALCETALEFADEVLAPGGAFVAKVLKGGTENELLNRMKRDFTQVKHAKPPASRADSAETYVVAKGFRGEKADKNTGEPGS